MSTIKDRVIELIEYKKIKKEHFFKKIGITSSNFRANARKTPLNSDAIANIFAEFPDMNIEWLITGQGNMLKSTQPIIPQSISQSNDPIVTYLEKTIKTKDTRIEEQAQEIGQLREKNEFLEDDNQELRAVIVHLRGAEDVSDVVAAS